MGKSNFQFNNPILENITFTINKDFDVKEMIDLPVSINSNVTVYDLEENATEAKANVAVKITIGVLDRTSPFWVEAVESADFKWTISEYTDKEVVGLLNRNAVALLISYVRPIIANITGASKYPAYNLPYIDLSKKEESPEAQKDQ